MSGTTNPRTAVTDTVLAGLSENVSDDDVLNEVLALVERQTADATIRGPGVMVDFEDYRAVKL